jgi:hypothetical protein
VNEQKRQDKLHLLASHWATWTREEQEFFMYDQLWIINNFLNDEELDAKIERLGLSTKYRLRWSVDALRKEGL